MEELFKFVGDKLLILVGPLSDEESMELMPAGKEITMIVNMESKPYEYWCEEKYALPFLEKKLNMQEFEALNKDIQRIKE